MVEKLGEQTSAGRRVLIYLVIIVILCAIIVGSFLMITGTFDEVTKDKVAVVYVQGTMVTASIPGGLGFTTSEEIVKSISDADKDSSVKAIILRINSPGGSPASAEEIIAAMERTEKPIVVSMGDVAASAAYYISAPADRIIANPDTITGSIGVIWVFEDRSEYYDEEGISFYVAKSGEFKDMGGDWRNLTDQEKEYADNVVMEVHDRFVIQVMESRNMSRSEVDSIADGRVYTGAEAMRIGLVDEMGDLQQAIDVAADLGGVEGEPNIMYMNKPSLARLIFGWENEDVAELVSYWTHSPYGRIVT